MDNNAQIGSFDITFTLVGSEKNVISGVVSLGDAVTGDSRLGGVVNNLVAVVSNMNGSYVEYNAKTAVICC